ncbi:Crp/Fnr family transcriptional regulator [Sphingorhabdus sp. 109]|jgi:CRP-like cAMP-binding protein|uniref:Crp/Fnr family transcriptional regulator n=1 Tax=Sphingorhabdus sp. 109 TaxID=2653173 RepID=UPI0012EF01D0|nr:Crp/Fnr family transcriptional regulator [Sphingorhabdus sp. 109]VWX57719.1 CRP-like cAMP-activated global transcriptional regulator [Sphingorhabdus sp. 109]
MSGAAPVAGTGFVMALPDGLRQDLLARGQPRRFAKGQIIQQRGDKAREFWYIESGAVQIGRYGRDGRLTLFALLGAGETFGELAFLGEFPRTVDAIAGSHCSLIRIGDSELQSLMDADAAVTRLLLKTMALTVQESFDLIEFSRKLSVPQRLAQALLQLSGDQPEVRVTQQDMADLVGVSRVSLGKAVTKLEAAGMIEPGYGVITIQDRAALLDMCGR